MHLSRQIAVAVNSIIPLTVKMKNNSINIAPKGKMPDMMILKERYRHFIYP